MLGLMLRAGDFLISLPDTSDIADLWIGIWKLASPTVVLKLG